MPDVPTRLRAARAAHRFVRSLSVASLLLLWCVVPGALTAQEASAAATLSDLLHPGLEYRYIGPIGNRVPAVTGVAGDPLTYYAGAASGGLFRSQDGGVSWQPVFDDQPAAAIGAVAVAPSDPNIVWVGTGETFIRSNVAIGNGVYRSVDGGDSFEHRGLDASGRIGRIVVHPQDPDIAWVAALGHAYGPQEERGVFKTTDGGETWRRVLFAGPHAGAIDLALSPTNSRILFAATWQIEIKTWGRFSGGAGSGLWRSSDGGETWQRLDGADGISSGLPIPPYGKIGLALSADLPDRVYALIETNSNRDYCASGPLSDVSEAPCDKELSEGITKTLGQAVLWRSDDLGKSFQEISSDHTLTQRPLYYTRAVAAPDNGNEITFMAVQQSISVDGGRTIEEQNSGWDHHDLWIDPSDPDRRISGHDGGVSITRDRGKNWYKPQLPIAQLYHVATDDRIPYFVYGNRQDGPSMRGPSRTLDGSEEIAVGNWHSVGGCEVGFAVPVPHSSLVWSGCYDGILDLHDLETGHTRNTSIWPVAVESWPAAELEYRIQWAAPLAISPHDPRVAYYGSQYVHRTADLGQSWQRISPDLTTNDPHLQKRWGGLTLDDAGPTIAPVTFAIAESHLAAGEIWVGTNDGQLQLTRDGGGTWNNLTERLPQLPPLGTVSNVEPSRHDQGRAYLTVDRHQLGDFEPYVFKTDDFGRSFTRIDGGLPRGVFGYAHCIREDPVKPGLLYLGTESGLWVSFDDGDQWHSIKGNLPAAPVHWLTIQEYFSDLVVATYGRGFYVLDDISPLRSLPDQGAASQLLAPRDTYRFLRREASMSQPDVPAAGENPPDGALVYVWYDGTDPEPATTADDSEEHPGFELRIFGSSETTSGKEPLRTIESLELKPGLNRLTWDLKGELSTEVELRNHPEQLNDGQPLADDETRVLSDGGRLALRVPPGDYRIELHRPPVAAPVEDDAREAGSPDTTLLSSTTLRVIQDPSSRGSLEDLQQQTDALEELWQQTDTAARAINRLEQLRVDLYQLTERLERHLERTDSEEVSAVLEQTRQVAARAIELEGRFFDLRLTSASQDTLRYKRLHYARLTNLARTLSGTDFALTESQKAVLEMLTAESEALAGTLDALETEVRGLSDGVARTDLPAIDVP